MLGSVRDSRFDGVAPAGNLFGAFVGGHGRLHDAAGPIDVDDIARVHAQRNAACLAAPRPLISSLLAMRMGEPTKSLSNCIRYASRVGPPSTRSSANAAPESSTIASITSKI